jgi:hypothetical protein
METVNLSVDAVALLRRRLADERVEVTEENRPIYRELVEAGVMIPINTFLGGAEGFYRLAALPPGFHFPEDLPSPVANGQVGVGRGDQG